jgi:rod shape determining protein RodA
MERVIILEQLSINVNLLDMALFRKKDTDEDIYEEFEEEEDSSGSIYIIIPIILQIVMAGLLYLKNHTAALNYLYALIPLLFGTSFTGSYVYNRNGDMKLFSAAAILTTIGTGLQLLVDQVYDPVSTFSYIKLVVSFVVAIVFVMFYSLFHRLLNQTWMVYVMMVISAIIYIVLLIAGSDPNGYGTSAWIRIGSITVQLTDFTKVSAVLFYSALFSSKTSHDDNQILVLSSIFFGINLIGSVLIKELGSFFILYFLHLSILFIFMNKSAKKRIYLLVIFGLTIGALGLAFLLYKLISPAHSAGTMNAFETLLWPILNKIHQRFSVTANINADPYGSGYQLLQGKKALWMAGWFGNNVNFTAIPVAESDMAYIALVNAFGHIMGFFVIFLFLRIMLSGSELSRKLLKTEKQDAIVVYAATILIVLQALIVILGSCNIIPFAGLPIPFLSRGGTYLTIVFCFIGLLLHLSEEYEEEEEEYDDE